MRGASQARLLQAAQEEAAPQDSEGGTFTEQCQQAIEAQGGDPAACDIDLTAWFSNLSNEGTEDVGGAVPEHGDEPGSSQ